MRIIIIRVSSFFFFLLPFVVQAQGVLKGKITELNSGKREPLAGVNIYWLGTSKGTTTNVEGLFELKKEAASTRLVVNMVGYKADTVETEGLSEFERILSPAVLQSVEINAGRIAEDGVSHVESISTSDLRKAACCNLSESFETNASVDVMNTDAVTGTKQIRMLGLDGIYAQLMVENIPTIRGLASRNGLTFIPGTWVKSIDISKGTGSVVNGYESISGQLNITLAQPDVGDKLLVNVYQNQFGRTEGNINTRFQLSKKLSTALLLHASGLNQAIDNNNDGFRDTPEFRQYNILNRWKYKTKNWIVQAGVNALNEVKIGGQNNYTENTVRDEFNPYGVSTHINRLQGFLKIGLLPERKKNQSIGLLVSGVNHDQRMVFGLSDYTGNEKQLWANLIFEHKFDPENEIRVGGSYLYNNFKEEFFDRIHIYEVFQYIRNREESVPGAFIEYAYNSNKFSLLLGLRGDAHNLYGTYTSPRVHLKYAFNEKTSIRASAGKGFRVTNPFVENAGQLAAASHLRFRSPLQPEEAWNYGLNFSHEYLFLRRKALLTIDFYRTDFINQVLIDMDHSYHETHIYNVSGAYANSFQIQTDVEVLKGLEVSLAYKYYDVQSPYDGVMREVAFVSQHRILFNMAYHTLNKSWEFDFTTKWSGPQRLPFNTALPNPDQPDGRAYSPNYFMLNAQITKNIKNVSLYIGGENIGNFAQVNPIISVQSPYSQSFDAGRSWGPILGRNIYMGFRWSIK